MRGISQVLTFCLLLITFKNIGKSQVKSECDLPALRVPGFKVEAHSHTDLSLAKSDVKPSVSPELAIPLSLDELQRGHLDNPTGRRNSYFWLVNVDAGSYKVGLDLWPDSIGGEVGGDRAWSGLNGQKLNSLGRMNKAPGPLRGVFKFATQNPRKLLLRYTNMPGLRPIILDSSTRTLLLRVHSLVTVIHYHRSGTSDRPALLLLMAEGRWFGMFITSCSFVQAVTH